jgi:hypothetical protein
LSNDRPYGEEYKILAEKMLSKARQEFVNIRGVSIREVILEVVNRSWVAENWGIPSDSEYEELLREEKIYKALFMIDQDVSLFDAKIDWVENFRAAKWQGKIYVVEENFDITDEIGATSTFIHELTHINQENYTLPNRQTFDGTKALTSLKEGDATFMADIFKNHGVIPTSWLKNSGNQTTISFPLFLPFGGEIQPSLPDVIEKINWFPYRYGLEFVEAIYDIDTWGAIENAYANPPSTTEQIMHPEKYIAGEERQYVEAPPIIGDWDLIETDRLGEYFILVMLDNWIPEDGSKKAAQGWGGDVFNYYEDNDEFFFTWNIIWDTEEDAHEFNLAFQDMMYRTSAEKHNCSYWFANGRYISLEKNEKTTLIISSADETLVQQHFLE